MEIYEWELATKAFFASFSRDDVAYQIIHFISYPKFYGWLLWIFLFGVLFYGRYRTMILPLILGGIGAGLGDLVSRRIFKVVFMRPRPWSSYEECFDAHCWGFVSSHCTNITAFVTVFALHNRKNLYWGIPVVVAVSFSRLYLLDHYPLDVLGGDFVGFLIGCIVWQTYRLIRQWRENRRQPELQKVVQTKTLFFAGSLLFASTLSFATYASIVRLTQNFYEVEKDRFYRSAQLNPIELNEKIKKHGIKTVISLRGSPEDSYWFKPEVSFLEKSGVLFKSYGLNANAFPSKSELIGILDDFKNAPKPILIHCRSGADRTGLVSALYVYEEMKKSKAEALGQLSFKYWHVRQFNPAMTKFITEFDGGDWASRYDPCRYPEFANGAVCSPEVVWE